MKINCLPELSYNRRSRKRMRRYSQKSPEIWRRVERRREEMVHPTNLPETLTLESTLAEKDSDSDHTWATSKMIGQR